MSNRLFKDYTDAEKYTQTLNNKISCRSATTGNITLSGTQTIDGVSLKIGDRVLVKNQTDASENGIYTCFSGGWHRSPDMDTTTKCRASSYIFIEEGSSIENVHKLFQLTLPDNASLVLGNSSLTFSEYGISGININGGSGSGINVIDDGNGDITINVNVDDTTIKINESNQVSAITASITEGATSLANGSQIYDFVYDNAVLLTTDQTIEGHKTFNGSMTINGNLDINNSITTINSSTTHNGIMTVNGNVTINGSETRINSDNLIIKDPLIKIADGNTTDNLDIGFYGEYNNKYSGLIRNPTDEEWYLFKDSTDNPPDTSNLERANLNSNLDGGIVIKVTAKTDLVQGNAVYIHEDTDNDTIYADKADASDTGKMPSFGLALKDIDADESGFVITMGNIINVSTSVVETGITLSEGNICYISASESGKITNIPPSSESNRIQNIGKVIRLQGSTFTLRVGGAGRTNATPALDNGNIFMGNASNNSVSTSLLTALTDRNVVFTDETQTLTNKTLTNSILNGSVSGTAVLNEDNMVSNSSTQVATQSSIKAYVDNQTYDDVSNANLLQALQDLESAGGSGVNGNITIGASSGDTLVITGNIQVNGSTTTVNSTEVTIEDKNIILGYGNTTADIIDGTGITLAGGTNSSNVTFQWASSGNRMELKQGENYSNMALNDIEVNGNVIGDVTGNLLGNASTATTLETARTIGGVSFDGSSNINLPGVNTAGNQNTSGNASTATTATTAIDISGITRSENSNTVLYINDSNNYDTASMTPFARTLLDDNSSSEARTTLGVDPAGTDNSTDVTLTSVASNYLTLTGQEITVSIVPISLGGTGATTDSAARTALGVDPAGTDNSTDVTLTSVASNYLTLTGQEITASIVPISLGGTGATTDSAARTALGIEIGTHVQAHDDGLTSIAGLTTTADNIIYTTGLDNYATASLTSYARTLLDDNSSAEARTTLGVDPAGTDNSTNVTLSNTNYLSLSGQVLTGNTVPVGSGGTGSTNLTQHGILIGNGTSAIISNSNLTFNGSDFILTGDTTLNGSMTLNGSLNLDGNIIPNASNTYNLGSSDYPFKDLFLSGKTLHLGDTKFTTNSSGDIEIMDNNDNPRKLMVDEIILGNGSNRVSLRNVNDKLSISMRDSDGTGNASSMMLDVDEGGTGQSTFENGQLLIGNGNGGLTKSTLTAGDNITIANGSGSISISSTGTVTSVFGTGTVNGITLNGTVTDSGSLTLGGSIPLATASASGLMSIDDKTKLDGITENATANTGTVTSVSGTGTVNGITLNGSFNNSGSLTLGGSIPLATASASGLMSIDDKTKLDGIETGANNYSLPLATNSSLGGVKIGYTQNNKNYPVELDDSEKMYVNVSWTDSDTLYSSGSGISLSNETFSVAPDQNTITSIINDSLVVGRDDDNQIKFSTDDRIIFRVGGDDNVLIDSAAMNFGGGYTSNGVTIYKTAGIISLRNSIRFYETNGNGTDGFVRLKAPDSWTQSSHGIPEYTLTLPLAIDTLVGRGTTDTLTNKTLTSPILTTPVLGTPSSGDLTNCTFPALNQDTTGSAGSVSNALTAGTNISFSSGTTYDGSTAITISASDTNTTYSNGSGLDLISEEFSVSATQTSITSIYNTSLSVGRSSTQYINFDSGTSIRYILDDFGVANVKYSMDLNSLFVQTGTADLGKTTNRWSNLYLAENGVINFDGNITLTHSNNLLSIGGGYLKTGTIYPESNNAYRLGTPSLRWSDLYLGSGAVINYDGGMALTHDGSSSTLDLTGASTGGFTCDGDITAYKSSDKRLKNNIKPIENPIEKIKKIGGYNFEWNKLGEEHTINKGGDVGVIAQEIEDILPEATTTRENGYKAVQYEKIVPLLIECIKDQQIMIENLQGQIDEIKSKII